MGVGKSTLLKAVGVEFKDDPDLTFVDEPVEKWEKSGLLAAMYSGKLSKQSFQSTALVTRARDLHRALVEKGSSIVICERSVHSDAAIFAEANLEEGSWDKQSYTMTHEAILSMLPKHKWCPIQLTASTDVLAKRVAARGREAEAVGVSVAYQDTINELHRKLLHHPDAHTNVCIDASADKDTVAQKVVEAVKAIMKEHLVN